MSQQRDFPLCLPSPLVSRRHRSGWLQFFRSGTLVQAVLSTSSISTSMFRPLRSTVVTRFSATMSPSDSPPGTAHKLFIPYGRSCSWGVSQVSSTDLSTRAAPFHPEQPGDCTYPLLRRRFWLHLLRQTGHCYLCNEADSGSRFITAARVFASQGFASRIASAHACSATCPTGN